MAKQPKAVAASGDGTAANEHGWVNGRYVYTLTKPIPDGGETVSQITLREPTTSDTIEAGSPCDLDPTSDPPRVVFNDRNTAAMISRLASIAPSSVGRMSPKDFAALKWIIADFFLPL